MSKRDDSQWATNLAYHRSPLYDSKGMYRGPKIERKREQQVEKSKSKRIERKRSKQTKISKSEQIKKNRLKQIKRNRKQQRRTKKNRLEQIIERDRKKRIENILYEFKIPYEFKTPYEFKGINLTYEIAERILVQYTGSPYLTIPAWAASVKSYHQKLGGLQPNRNLLNIVFIALNRLGKKGYASKDSTDRWKILPLKR